MASNVGISRAPIEIVAGRSGLAMAEKICEKISRDFGEEYKPHHVLVRPGIDQFPSGEFKVALEDSVRGKDVYLVQNALDRTNPGRDIHVNMWEAVQAIDNLWACEADHVTVIMPYLPYSRQDKRDGRESAGAMLWAKQLASAGAERMITMDLHASQIKLYYNAVGMKCEGLYATNIFLDYIKSNYSLDNLVVLAPDEGAAKRASYYAGALFSGLSQNDREQRIVHSIKQRCEGVASKVLTIRIQGDLSGKNVVVVDDMFDTGGTMRAVVDSAKDKGAKDIAICVAHALLSDPATDRLDSMYNEGLIKELITTDSVPHPEEYIKGHKWFTQLSMAPMLAEMIERINTRKATSDLYL